MDVATGATDVPLPQPLISFLLILFCFLTSLSLPQKSFAITENKPIHFSGDKQVWDRKKNQVQLFGHAAVTQTGETLTAEYILLDLNSRVLDARGNCVYNASDSVIWGEQMHFNLDTRTGSVVDGRVSNEFFTLRGNRINRLGFGRYQTHWGNYTTCRDCSASWSILAEDVDMQVDGYAWFTNVTTNIKDAPAFWMPYLVIPMKTRRQSGLLFPSFGSNTNNGATILQPFFWAIDRSVDMTFGLGLYTQRGPRFEWETRYALSSRSTGVSNFFYLEDRSGPPKGSRWALNFAQTQELPWGIDEKLNLAEVSDNLYPFYFPGDIRYNNGGSYLKSNLIFSRGSSDASGYLSLSRTRNLLNATKDDRPAQESQFDSQTVQALPSIMVTTNDRPILGSSLLGGISLGLTNFTRTADSYDLSIYSQRGADIAKLGYASDYQGFVPGVDPIRKATRISFTPTLYTTLRPFDVLTVVPSLQYRGFYYNFGNLVPDLNRGYLLFQTDLSTQLEKIYSYPDDKDIPRVKHLIRPVLTYSYIPYINEDLNHPFIQQIKGTRGTFIPGYNFDNYDIVPYGYQHTTTNYFIPLGNSLSYGLSTQWIRRRGRLDSEDTPSYQHVIEFKAGQSIDFLELSKPGDPNNRHLLTRLFSQLDFNFDRFQSQTVHYYYPDYFPVSSRNTLTTSASFVFERALHQRFMTFDRSFTISYNYNKIAPSFSHGMGATLTFSISDYLMPYGRISYNLEPSTDPNNPLPPALSGASGGLVIQSPSQCWKLATNVFYAPGLGMTYNFDLMLNFTGSGYGGITEFANQLVSH